MFHWFLPTRPWASWACLLPLNNLYIWLDCLGSGCLWLPWGKLSVWVTLTEVLLMETYLWHERQQSCPCILRAWNINIAYVWIEGLVQSLLRNDADDGGHKFYLTFIVNQCRTARRKNNATATLRLRRRSQRYWPQLLYLLDHRIYQKPKWRQVPEIFLPDIVITSCGDRWQLRVRRDGGLEQPRCALYPPHPAPHLTEADTADSAIKSGTEVGGLVGTASAPGIWYIIISISGI